MKTVSLTNISIYRSVYMAHISALLHGAVGAEVQIPSTKNPELSNVSLFSLFQVWHGSEYSLDCFPCCQEFCLLKFSLPTSRFSHSLASQSGKHHTSDSDFCWWFNDLFSYVWLNGPCNFPGSSNTLIVV